MTDYGPICCRGECCGPGSYCCGHPNNIHTHTEEEENMSERDDLTEQVFHSPEVVLDPTPTEEGLYLDFAARVWRLADGEWACLDADSAEFRPRTFLKLDTESLNSFDASASGLNFLLELQGKVEAAWGRTVDPSDPKAVSAYIRDVVLCATDELHEVLGEVNWKPWKDVQGIKDMDKYREEMADVLHFILDLYLAAGLTGRDITVDYLAKHAINLARVQSTAYRTS